MATPRDPVCGMNLRDDRDDRNLRSDYEGQNYRFCSDRCKEEFDRNPASYARSQNENRNESRGERRNEDRNDNRQNLNQRKPK
ncbi:MAG: YHS domain-containing protein [Bacillota bacterium]|jgi:YHS domain-containing protein